MRPRHLIVAAAWVGAALVWPQQARAIFSDYTFDNPADNLGPTQVYESAPPGGGDVTATAEGAPEVPALLAAIARTAEIVRPDLFGKPGEGLGLTGTPGNDIVPGTFIQLDLINLKIPPLTSPRLGFRAGSVDAGDEWEVFGTNIADTLDGATLIASGGHDLFVHDLGTDIIGVFRYLDITAAHGGVLLAQLGIDFTPPDHHEPAHMLHPGHVPHPGDVLNLADIPDPAHVPEPASLALLGTMFFGFAVLRHRRR